MSQNSKPVGAEVWNFDALEPRPGALDGIELGRIGGQSVSTERGLLTGEIARRLAAAVRMESVPQQHDRAADVPAQVPQEADDLGGANDIVVQREVEASGRGHSLARWAIGQGSDRGESLPRAMAMDQDGRLTARRPRTTNGGSFREPALVEEDERGSAASGVFFSRGHVSWTQR